MNANLKWLVGSLILVVMVGALLSGLSIVPPKIIFVNKSGKTLSAVKVISFDSQGEYSTVQTDLAPGDQLITRRRVPDLYPRRISFEFDGKSNVCDISGIACWGETLIVTANRDGSLETTYGPPNHIRFGWQSSEEQEN